MNTIRALLTISLVTLASCAENRIDCFVEPSSIDPTVSCADFDPCTHDTYSPDHGCSHDLMPNDSQCFGDDGSIGKCSFGFCVFVRNDFEDAICVEASRGCHGYDPYVIKQIEGSCVVEWCNYDKPGRSIQPKAAGSPCVRSIAKGSPEFRVSQCNPCGECL